jgi:hypothetical protein
LSGVFTAEGDAAISRKKATIVLAPGELFIFSGLDVLE